MTDAGKSNKFNLGSFLVSIKKLLIKKNKVLMGSVA